VGHGDSFDLPSHFDHDAFECTHDAAGGFPEGGARGDFLHSLMRPEAARRRVV